MSTKFSIIIPAYNTGTYIENCINSVLYQSFRDYEVIVIDDCSDDNNLTQNTLEKFPTISVYKTLENSGPAVARNLGISKANGEYIIFLDSDDTLSSNDVLEKLSNTIGEKSPDIIYTGFQFVGEQFCFIPNDENSTKEFRLAKNKFMNVWSICWNRKFLKEHNIKFSEKARSYEDVAFAFWGIALANTCKQADYVTHNYTRNRPDSTSDRFSNPAKHFNQSRNTITCIEDLYNLQNKIPPKYLPYLVARINEQKSRLIVRLDRGLSNLLESEKDR